MGFSSLAPEITEFSEKNSLCAPPAPPATAQRPRSVASGRAGVWRAHEMIHSPQNGVVVAKSQQFLENWFVHSREPDEDMYHMSFIERSYP